MLRITIRKLLQKNPSIRFGIETLVSQSKNGLVILDQDGSVILGQLTQDSAGYEVIADDAVIGKVIGDQQAEAIAQILQSLVNKDTEKRKLGDEVLHLYREINLIYKYSEKLSETIDPTSIASLALEEANHLIEANGGVVIIQRQDNSSLEIIGARGKQFIDEDALNERNSSDSKLALLEQAGILTSTDIFPINVEMILNAPLKVKGRVLGNILLYRETNIPFTAADLKLLTTLSLQSASAIENALLFEKGIREAKESEAAIREVHQIATKFVPNEFIQLLGHQKITDVALGDGVEREVTVIFCDIRGYTSLAEAMTPEENFKFVNSFNGRIGPIISQNEGFIIQYLGDGHMALFPKNPANALEAAISIQNVINGYNEERKLKGRNPVKMGIGVHTGPLIMGIIGDQKRMDAAVISDTVNSASRIESLTKIFGANILVSEHSLNGMGSVTNKERANFRFLGKVLVKGKKEFLGIYECFSDNAVEVIQLKIATKSLFETGMAHYFANEFSKAETFLSEVLKENPADLAAEMLVKELNLIKNEKVITKRAPHFF